MALRNVKHTRRYVIGVFVIVMFVYFSGIHLSQNTSSRPWRPDSESASDVFDSITNEQPLDPHEQEFGAMPVDSSTEHERESLRKRIDEKYCASDRCRFLLPIAITEQESKAQEHFRQLAFLSGKLKRTIVLPNVHSSHLGACRKLPFHFYYSNEWLENNKEHFNYITMDDFHSWIHERRQLAQVAPSAQEVFIEMKQDTHLLDDQGNCFRDLLDFSGRPTRHFYLPDPESPKRRQGNYTEILMDMLADGTTPRSDVEYEGRCELDNTAPLDVIALFYDRRFGFIEQPQVHQPLTYNQRWVNLANEIANQLKPFVAIHWRMERLEPVDNLVPCAASLVGKVQEVASESDTSALNVFLLTDYPHLLTSPSATPESMSFKLDQLKQEHHDAIRYVYERLNVTLTTIMRENQSIPYQDLPSRHWNILPVPVHVQPPDTSVLGIVDKLVAMRAQYFLAGYKGICGKSSSFTGRIKDERIRAQKAGDPSILSPVSYFSLPSNHA